VGFAGYIFLLANYSDSCYRTQCYTPCDVNTFLAIFM